LEIGRIIKVGYLQQNAFHEEDRYVPLEKQFKMLELISYLYDRSIYCVKKGIPISKVESKEIFDSVIKVKYNVPNDDFSKIDEIRNKIDEYYNELEKEYLG
jgi:V/A-type H+-transporting ATPase subunit A